MKTLSQEERVLKMLRQARNRGVPNHKFQSKRILCYTKVISNLRAEGYPILTERVWLRGRATGTYIYYLNESY